MKLRTSYMGLELRNPLIASASPLTEHVHNIRQMEDAGVAGVIMFSLFEEQLRHDAAATEFLMSYGAESYAEAVNYFPEVKEFKMGSHEYLDLIQRAVKAVDIPIIGSLNGVTNEGWISHAKDIEDAGAAGLELNVYYLPTELDRTGAEVEQLYLDIAEAVKASVDIPVSMKMNPYFSAIGNMAQRLEATGLDGLALFNRFYQPDLDLETLDVLPNLKLSDPYEMRLPLRWIAILYGRLGLSLGATTGVHSAQEMIKYIMAGADVTMTTSALLRNGIDYAKTMLADLRQWMTEREYESVSQMRGSMSQQAVSNPEAFVRANYLKVLDSYKVQAMP